MKYRKKPVIVDAWKWDGKSYNDAWNLIKNKLGVKTPTPNFRVEDRDGICIIIKTLEGEMQANPGDYIIRGVNGEYYPCKSDIFGKTYELI